MATSATQDNLRDLAERHAQEAERLLKGTWISSHIKAQAHASLAVYYESRLNESGQ
jgi:hypothetical protein